MMRSTYSLAITATMCVVLLSSFGASAKAAEEQPPPAADHIKQWIKDLGSEDFQKRSDAKAALLKAGNAAVPHLTEAKNSTEVEVKNSANWILSRLRWSSIRKNVDYLELFPADSIMAVSIPSIAEVVSRSKESPFGKILTGEKFKPLMDLINKKLADAPAQTKTAEKWFDRFQGAVGGAIWSFNPMEPSKMGMAAVAELPKEKPGEVFKELLNETGSAKMLLPKEADGLSYMAGPNGMGAVALVGNHVVLAANVESLMIVCRGLVGPNAKSLKASPRYTILRPHLGDAPQATFFMDFQAYKKMLGPMMAMMPGGNMGGFMDKMGYDTFETMAMTSSVSGDGFIDRFIVTLNDKPTNMNTLMKIAWKGTTPLKEVFSIAPADAVMIGNNYMEGEPMLKWAIDYVKGMMELQGAAGQQMPKLDDLIAQAETEAGVKLADVASAVKGNAVYWVRLAETLAPPELGSAIGCVDAAKAEELAGNLAKLTDGICRIATKKPAPAIEKIVKEGQTIFTESADSPLMANPKRKQVPYKASWTAVGDKVVIGSSVDDLLKRVRSIKEKETGFDPTPMLGAVKPGEAEAKTLFAVKLKEVLNYGAKFGLPMLAPVLQTQPDLQGVVAALALKPDLFAGLAPITVAGHAPKDGVMVSTMRSPIGVVPTYAIVIAGGFMWGVKGVAAPGQAPVPPPPPPGGGGF